MAAPQAYRTPGIHFTEADAFASSITGVETAIPAFVGYTEKAEIDGRPAFFTPLLINSLAEYEAIFGKGFSRQYGMVQVTAYNEIDQGKFDFTSHDPQASTLNYYRLVPETPCRFHLYNSLRLFYANAGGTGKAFVVSAGTYVGTGTTLQGCAGVKRDALLQGLSAVAQQVGPTMLLVPDAVALPADDGEKPWSSQAFASIVRGMLTQAATLQDRTAILDVYGTEYADATNLNDLITEFHEDVGDQGLGYGASYFPFLETSVVQGEEISYMNIAPDSRELFRTILTQVNADLYNNGSIPAEGEKGSPNYEKVQGWIAQMWSGAENVQETNENLVTALSFLQHIQESIRRQENILPPSGAIAGIYAMNDATRGVWNAPANIVLNSVSGLTFALDNTTQGELNVPIDGKAVNAIRSFVGRGPVVWGARTLDGNSNDWRYIQVRRTVVYIEESIKTALGPFVFAPNNANTWATVTAMISSFLQSLWSQGGLMGATPSDAYTVQCGLGSTMTGQDILDGYMIVQVTLQMIRPAEFIELTFKQRMEGV